MQGRSLDDLALLYESDAPNEAKRREEESRWASASHLGRDRQSVAAQIFELQAIKVQDSAFRSLCPFECE